MTLPKYGIESLIEILSSRYAQKLTFILRQVDASESIRSQAFIPSKDRFCIEIFCHALVQSYKKIFKADLAQWWVNEEFNRSVGFAI